MRTISAQAITDTVARLCIEANTHLPKDVEAALTKARAEEPWPLAKNTLDLLWSNLSAAKEENLPICQDTGSVWVCLEVGESLAVPGNIFSRVNDAVARAYTDGRLRMSLQAGGSAQKIAFLHYPPVYPGGCAQPLVDILHEFGVQQCYYGHLHGKSIRGAIQREVDGIRYKLVSADGLHFCPYKICD